MPLAVYLGLLLHSQTRQKNLIDKVYSLGLSISFEKVYSHMELSIISIIIRVLRRHRARFMGQGYHYFKTENRKMMEKDF